MRRALALAAVLALAGCSEDTQVSFYEGKYDGKVDVYWDSAPPPYGTAQWERGDPESWRSQISRRALAQNEAVRIQHP